MQLAPSPILERPSNFQDRRRSFRAQCFAQLIRQVEGILGPAGISAVVLPLSALSSIKMFADYLKFRNARKILPRGFWPLSAHRHYLRTMRVWQESLAIVLVYDRLKLRRWQERLTFSGTPPDQISNRRDRPMVVVFLHTGGYAVLRYWLRARGVPAASFVLDLPRMLRTRAAARVRAMGDACYSMEDVPHTFRGEKSLRDVLRFLQPGRVLIMALDGAPATRKVRAYPMGEHLVKLKDGAVRIARSTNAVLVPATVRHCGPCRFEFRFGAPVPDALIAGADSEEAMRHLAREFWTALETDPSSMEWTVLGAIVPKELQGNGR